MRGTVAKSIRRGIYGRGKDKKEKMAERKFGIINDTGTIIDRGFRRQYQAAKTWFKSLPAKQLVTKLKKMQAIGLAR